MEVFYDKLANCFRVQGRCYVSDERLFLNASGGSLQGTFQGTELTFDVWSDYVEKGRNAYVRVIVDGRSRRVRLPKGEKAITMRTSDGRHDFEIVKLTESANNSFGIHSVRTDGEFLPWEKQYRPKIEFIGDSITTGFGVLAHDTYGEYKTKEQDFTKAFPYLVSKALDADYHVVAAGGWPIYKSKYSPYAIPDYYDNVDLLRNTDKYDFGSFTPDIVVITLGTNDFSYLADLPPERMRAERDEVRRHYLTFLSKLLGLYPHAIFVLLYGFFDYLDLGILTEEVASAFRNDRISTLVTDSASSIGDVRAGHPGQKAHAIAARKLLSILGYGIKSPPPIARDS